MAKKNFDKGRKVPEPHEITLAGQTIRLHGTTPAATFLDDRGNFEGFQGVVDFLRTIVVPADREAFESILTSEEVYVSQDDIIAVSNWYVGVVGGRPTNGSGPSEPGPEATSTTSGERSGSEAAVGTS